ncbi:YpjP family protein [Peribacillus glennii]|uniref:Cell division protein FtsK n=1 Tax=Peribacillus glennii TaxID=2303991 RepID=A0A372LGN8_9BACI|nr:YpjP family protein [Peribacillus glennii]RFU65457.1 hypothetical protein D0466_06095 [Peribacillus glennii]
MKTTNWLRKFLVVLVSILTFGLVTPTDFHWRAQADGKNLKKDSIQESEVKQGYELLVTESPVYYVPIDRDVFVGEMILKAEEQSFSKFGGKITPKIEDEFKGAILPKIEQAIKQISRQFPDEELMQLAISVKPAAGRGEKIFHIYNEKTNEDVIRFHARQENPPKEGHWFNFHYHTYHDGFSTHYELGRIYWDKNTPPQWSDGSGLS